MHVAHIFNYFSNDWYYYSLWNYYQIYYQFMILVLHQGGALSKYGAE